MRIARRLRVSYLTLLASCVLLTSHVAAQNLPKLPPAGGTTTNTAAATTNTAAATTKGATATTTPGPTKTTSATTPPSSTQAASASSSDLPGLTGLPKLAQDDYPAPTVPPTADAPFMQKSNLPDGTVFIAVGAALGFFGFLVLAWRGLVAWSLHRSVKRAAMAQSAKYAPLGGDPTVNLGKTKGPYFNPGRGSTLSLDHLGTMGKGGTGKGATTSQSARGSLFFSPTAGAAMHTQSNRGSSYLPAGYYAAGNSAPSGGSGITHIGGGGIGLSSTRPESQRYSRARSIGASPPVSPNLPPSRGGESTYYGRQSTVGLTTHASNSSLNLSAAPQSRAPSAYLDDLFENHVPGSSQPEEHGRGRR